MTPTPKMLEELYCLICKLPPINKWKMPSTAEIVFKVSDHVYLNNEKCYATYTYDDGLHEILISREMNKTFNEILCSMLHEMIHMRRAGKTEDWDKHDAVFKKYAKTICEEFGLNRIGF